MMPAIASPITSLFNTGVSSTGAVLPDGSVGDPHYQIVSAPSGTTDVRIRTEAGGWPIPPYTGDNNLSRWIGPNNDQWLDGDFGVWDYKTTFSLTTGNVSTASITGRVGVDNVLNDVLLNGHSLSIYVPWGYAAFADWQSFSIGQYFVSGENTLEFLVYNGGGPTALRVEMTGDQELPDAGSSAALLGVGLATVGWMRRKLKA